MKSSLTFDTVLSQIRNAEGDSLASVPYGEPETGLRLVSCHNACIGLALPDNVPPGALSRIVESAVALLVRIGIEAEDGDGSHVDNCAEACELRRALWNANLWNANLWEREPVETEAGPARSPGTRIEISGPIRRGSFSSQFTVCEVSPDGSRDGFEEFEVQHGGTDPVNDAADIDAAMAKLSDLRDLD